jgi:hypothetical protein
MKNKLLMIFAVMFLGYASIFSDGYKGGGVNPRGYQAVDNTGPKQARRQAKNRGDNRWAKGQRDGSRHKHESRFGGRGTYAPSALENTLRRSSAQMRDLASALGRLRMENDEIFKKYFGSMSLENENPDLFAELQ